MQSETSIHALYIHFLHDSFRAGLWGGYVATTPPDAVISLIQYVCAAIASLCGNAKCAPRVSPTDYHTFAELQSRSVMSLPRCV